MTDKHCPECPHPWFHVALLLNRISIGLYLLLAGTGKLNGGLVEFVNGKFSELQPPWLPDAFALPYGYALPFLEILVGALLIIGFLTRSAAWFSLLMVVSFTIAVTIDIGSLRTGPEPFTANLILITLLFLIAVAGPGNLSIDHRLFKAKATKK